MSLPCLITIPFLRLLSQAVFSGYKGGYNGKENYGLDLELFIEYYGSVGVC